MSYFKYISKYSFSFLLVDYKCLGYEFHILHYFSFQPVLHYWCNKGHGMCYPVCGMMHIKEPLLLIGKSSPMVAVGFPLAI